MTAASPAFAFIDETWFESRYNRASFQFSHNLDSHRLFSMQSIIELANRRRDQPALAYWSSGRVGVGDSWATGTAYKASLQETLENIAVDDSLVMLRQVESDPQLGPFIGELMSAVMAAVGPRMALDVIRGRGTLLIASPHRITSYHLDSDTNFLFQIRGSKTLHVLGNEDCDQASAVELENYFAGDPSAVKFSPERGAAAVAYELCGGDAVHIPSLAPHWAENRDDVSIALSINFDLRSVDRIGRIFRVNRRLRRVGLAPKFPGRSPWVDRAKLAAVDAAQRLKNLLTQPTVSGPGLR
jgi:hypothetical protein